MNVKQKKKILKFTILTLERKMITIDCLDKYCTPQCQIFNFYKNLLLLSELHGKAKKDVKTQMKYLLVSKI